MNRARIILLTYKRHPELVNDEHLFSGSLSEVLGEIGGVGTEIWLQNFINWSFRRMMTNVSAALRNSPNALVLLQRKDRPGLNAVQLGEEIRVLLRDDPVAAIRTMNPSLGRVQQGTLIDGRELGDPKPMLRSCHDTLADAFGERIYLRMRNGTVEDPLTGKWKQLAYGPELGWAIRGDNNASSTWVRIRLEGVETPALSSEEDVKANMESVTMALATCKWASTSVEDLLKYSAKRFFLPRRWNGGEQWIDRSALGARLEKFREERVLS